jgi:type IV pilus assembly protein PilA
MLDRIKKLKKSDKGFTIIEVMIVLAIAGLIILIVFLAVPALQRNSRNTQRKNDVSGLIAAISEYSNNNAGVLPKDQATLDSAATNAKLGYFDPLHVYFTTAAPAVPSPITSGAGSKTVVTTDDIIVAVGFKCSSATTAPSADTSRSIAVVYAVETGGNPTYQCQSS